MNFFVSTLAEYFANGRQWINSVNRALVEAMGENDEGNDQKRAALINSLIASEQLCRYGHYIRNIEVPNPDDEDSPDIIEGEDEIRDILKLLSAEPETVNNILRSVDNYIQTSVVSLVGSINVPCSKCGKLHLNRGGEAKLILPFNAALGFYPCATQDGSRGDSSTDRPFDVRHPEFCTTGLGERVYGVLESAGSLAEFQAKLALRRAYDLDHRIYTPNTRRNTRTLRWRCTKRKSRLTGECTRRWWRSSGCIG